jgi:O-antigen/teichoic acid export membrane protein
MAQRQSIVGLLIPVFFSLGALLLYSSTYQSRRLPRFISIWGLVGVVLVLALNLVLLFLELDTAVAMILALPIILNEVFLGIWLIVVGFNPRSA